MTMPTLFLAHGTPMNAIESNTHTKDWQRLANLEHTPKAILCISAHWCTSGEIRVSSASQPATLHDFSGFPQALRQHQYPAPGWPKLADDICALLSAHHCKTDPNRGFDHGCWSVLSHLYPDASIPCVQLSLNLALSPKEHGQVASKLSKLREQGVLIIASGNLVHNIPKWLMEPSGDPCWAIDFAKACEQAILNRDINTLYHYENLPYARDAVPTTEHFLPIIYAIMANADSQQVSASKAAIADLESAAMRSYRFS